MSAQLEALLLVVDEPAREVVLAAAVEQPVAAVAAALRGLATDYDSRGAGIELREVAGGWRLYTRRSCAPVVKRFLLEGQQARLTQAALETLAVVAYRQPVSRSRIAAVRGVQVDAVLRTLQTRGLVQPAGQDERTGAVLFATTDHFLERLGLRALDELPALAPLLPEVNSVDDA